MNKNRKFQLIVAIAIFALVLSACASPQAPAGLSPEQAQATANSAVLTAMAEAPIVQTMDAEDPSPTPAREETATPTAPAISGAQGSDYQGAEGCQDGKIISNQYADISRIPIGTLEGAIIAEISWTGSGFGGFNRAVVVIPRMTSETMAFVLKSRTIHLVQYCGFLQDILNWAPTHVDALVQSSQDNQGNRPDPKEIGVYFLNLDGSWQVVREGPLGPGLGFVQQRVIMTP